MKMNATTINCYAGNMVYKNDKSLNYLLFDEGLVTKTLSVYSYEYHLKDPPSRAVQVFGRTRVAFQLNSCTTTTTQVVQHLIGTIMGQDSITLNTLTIRSLSSPLILSE